ncbi:alanine racemase [Ferrimonas marina]|uniref:D-serine deaminase, pyridoxal phosphate-dependent n=1 Tax=Ferrimonas marina TaxID=299255 RepID=A0A1M5MK21_9GAMM|nr:alanine racemase [Ferrimonas marina]SHG77259.1 D-serine deaminase, pyridoxal phosphate-dependent [Ferrimonas marina]
MTPFPQLQQALEQSGRAEPSLVIDLAALDHNLALVRDKLAGQGIRLVVKSLPSIPLLRYCLEALQTDRLMAFHRPFVSQVLTELPHCRVMMGKPLPRAAVAQLLGAHGQRAADQVQWLVDSPQRLEELGQLAQDSQHKLKLAVEINVGMERGGLDSPRQLVTLAQRIQAHPWLELSGVMGYDAHVAKAPLGRRQAASDRAKARYLAFLSALTNQAEGPTPQQLDCNGAGSPTLPYHRAQTPVNDVSLGSLLLKPCDFDLPDLAEFLPAAYIATPILKRLPGVRLPFLGRLSRKRDTLFLYGGRWMAQPVWPEGMAENRLYGLSSNQQMMTVPQQCPAQIDDWAFFRPTQSEAVLLQFGDLLAVREHQVVMQWPPLQQQG